MNTLLKVENLKKYFPVRKGFLRRGDDVIRAVDGIQFELRQGETLGFVGESGCGKSTTGRLILRLIDPTEGRIWFRDRDITGLSRKAMRPLRQKMQIIFQDPYSSLNPRMTVKDIIGEGLKRNAKMNTKEREERVFEIMEKVGLRPEHSTRYPHEFSGGQRQRISIARVIVLNPELVVADEPLSALDVSIQAQVINLMEKLKEDFRLSYLFISHDLSVVEHISDRIVVMYLGKIVELAPRDLLYDDPKHPYTIALLSAVPLPQVKKKKERIILKGDIPSPINPPQGCRFHTRCNRSMEACSHLEPKWKEVEKDHFTACHLF
ncbi:MAG: dipeptide ABC transporter ATP-binding protein [Deltaproteobacteria bacterium]|nr:dipeptide ABC transporter ATP-binding protein [Deltaproteobacteria bacterium]MBW2148559.1 dipeptide ABC transporter ATP-binding protein [Deltaproteobacteria bacterium]MBW2308984.1 dipeptide ABC transporter ATP-binding protein [Deltaproteobacteria bacterium]